MRGPMTDSDRPIAMREIPVELTPRALAQIQRWLLLLAGDDTAPAWDPGEKHDAPGSLQAAAQWLVDNGHGGALDDQLVAVLLALFSMNVQWKLETEIEGRFIPQGADNMWLVDLHRLARDCALTLERHEHLSAPKPSKHRPRRHL
jgi:hypothetical protein